MKHTWIGHSWTAPRPAVVPRVVLAQYSERPPWGSSGRNIHHLWILDYARTDCGLARVGSPRAPWLPRKARTANLYPPGTPYWEDTSGLRNPIREAYVIFAGGESGGLRRLIAPGRRFGRIADPAARLDAPFHDMALAGQTLGEAGFWRAQAALAAIFDLLGAAAPQADGSFLLLPQEPPATPAGIVEATRQYFRAHLAEKVTLAAVARQLGMSSSAFSHRYATEAGQSPMAALAALRVELARNLLLRGLKMETIAQQTGFCDAFHFSKAFKRHCGQTPSEFRGSWQSGR
jgi:AraC-like DNA-binding protein